MQVKAPVVKKKAAHKKMLDDFDEDLVRRTIHSMQMKSEYVSIRRLTAVLEEKGLRVKKSLLWRTVKKLGFRFSKKGSDRRFLGERQDIVNMRHTYLRSIKKFRAEGRPIVYLDETWLNTNHVARGDWVDCPNTSTSAFEPPRGGQGRFIPSGKGSRLIIVDAGCSTLGMIPNSSLIFESKSGSQDYHDEMNSENFTKWFTDQLLPNLPVNSVIVMDNASYHSHLDPESKCPTTGARKTDIQSWLDRKGIHYEPHFIKAELLELVKQHKPRPKYVIDTLASASGHTVLRLPPYHCELNPIELVWADMKSYVARNNATFKKEKAKELFYQARSFFTKEKWQKIERHVIEEVEAKLWKLDGVQEEEIAPVVVDLADSDSETDLDSSDEEHNNDTDLSTSSTEESDSETICCICHERDTPGRTKTVKWFECEICESWCHDICSKASLKSGKCLRCWKIFKNQDPSST